VNAFRAVAFHDPYLPSVLCELLLDKHNSGKMCNKVSCLELNELMLCIHLSSFHSTAKIDLFMCAWSQVATCILDVAEVMGDDHLRKGEIGIFSHEWIDMPVSHEVMADRYHACPLRVRGHTFL